MSVIILKYSGLRIVIYCSLTFLHITLMVLNSTVIDTRVTNVIPLFLLTFGKYFNVWYSLHNKKNNQF